MQKDSVRTDQELLAELAALRSRVRELEASLAACTGSTESPTPALANAPSAGPSQSIGSNHPSLLQMALAASHAGAFDTNLTTGVIVWSPELEALYGFAPGEFGGHLADWRACVLPEDVPKVDADVQRAVEQAEPLFTVFRIRRRDTGETHWMEARARFIHDTGRDETRLVGFNIDVTDRVQAEESLRKSMERLGIAQRASHSGLWDWNMLTQTLTWTPEFLELFGLPPDTRPSFEVWLNVVHPDDREPAMARIASCIENRTPLENEYRIILPGGRVRWIMASGEVLYNGTGQAERMCGICVDITSRKGTEIELERSQRLYAAISQINQAVVRLKDRDELFQEVCRVLVEFGGFPLAWVAQVGPVPHEIACVARQGNPDAAELALRLLFEHSPTIRAAVLEEEQPFVTNDILGTFGPRALDAERAASLGGSLAVCPIREGATVVGVFCIHSPEKDFFGKPEMALLIEAGLDISFALDNIARENQRLQSLEALYASEARLRAFHSTSLDGHLVFQAIRENGRVVDLEFTFANPAAERIMNRGPLVGRRLLDVMPGHAGPGGLFERYVRVIETGEAHDIEFPYEGECVRGWFRNMSVKLGDGVAMTFSDISARKKAEAEVEILAIQRQLALDVAQLGWWHYDPVTRISTWDDRYRAIFGVRDYSKPNEEILARLHPEDLPDVLRKVEQALDPANAAPYAAEYRINLPDGSVRWIDAHGIASFEGEGENRRATQLIGTVADVTERKRNEEKLLHAHQLMHYIISHARSAIAVHDRDLRYLYVSDRYLRDYEVKERDLLGKHHYEVFPDLPQKWRDVHRRALAGEVLSAEEDAYVRDDGSVVWTRWECRPWHESDGAIGGIIVYTEVITDQVNARQALRQSLEELKKAQALANIGSWTWHVREDRLEGSEQLHRIFGVEPGATEEQIAKAVMATIHPEDRAHLEQGQRTIRRFESPGPIEFRMVLPDNKTRTIRIEVGETTRDDRGTPLQVKGIVQDVTELKRAAEERQHLQLQLLQAQKMESVGRLAGGVAHDFNNMLGVILGCAELALRDLEPDSTIRLELDEIQKAAQRSAELTRQLLAFARKQTLMPRVLDLNDAVAGMLKMLRRLIGEDIDLSWHPGPEVWPVYLDPGQVDQILVNLLVNARDAIGTAGAVAIETGNVSLDHGYCASHGEVAPGDYVMLTVSDNGQGMDEVTRQHIFEPFYTTKATGEGTGLGLATVYGSVVQANGHINVYSEPGLGTTFRIYFPRHSAKVGTTEPQATGPRPQGHGETILLVEDEIALLKITRTMLQMLGYRVLPANSCQEAIELAREHHGELHLLLTDVVMPNVNGRQLAEQLLSENPTMRLLYMSGYTANVIAQHGILDEGINFIEKPVSLDDLAFKVRAVLDAP